MASICPKNELKNVDFCPILLGQKFFVHCLGELQCWTEGRSSTAVAEDLGPKATAHVAEDLRPFLRPKVFIGSFPRFFQNGG